LAPVEVIAEDVAIVENEKWEIVEVVDTKVIDENNEIIVETTESTGETIVETVVVANSGTVEITK
jgi:hypothetical protein